MKIQIKRWTDQAVIFECEAESLREAVIKAVGAKSNLQSADLQSANLQSANLQSANLQSANLRSADLRSADLRSADLRFADLRSADLRFADLQSADLQFADLQSADLQSADLQFADLQSADLQSADLDYSCWHLSCNTNHVKVDAKFARQLAAHFCVLDCDDAAFKKVRRGLLAFAKKSHRALDLGLVKSPARAP